MNEATWWLLLNLFTIAVMGYFSMIEMACISFNRVRLQYYASKGARRAKWLSWLMERPARLFGTTLIGVNVSMMVGSECARKTYEALGYPAEIAPLTQILIVITMGELAPMFAARRHPEHVVMLGMPILYATSTLLKPFLWGLEKLTHALSWLLGTTKEGSHGIFLTREELENVLQSSDDIETPTTGTEDFNQIISYIFKLREKRADQLMERLRPLHTLSSTATVGHMRHIMRNSDLPYLPIYHKRPTNIVGIAFPRDLIRIPDEEPLRKHARPPWFITLSSGISSVLTQFRRNNQSLAVVLDKQGRAQGFLTLESVLLEIFGPIEEDLEMSDERERHRVIERTVSGEMAVSDFATEFAIDLDRGGEENLSQLMTKILGHVPDVGEHIVLTPLRLTVRETSLTGAKTISVTTHSA
jgi:CBS domain containing-hemolysin-like protein